MTDGDGDGGWTDRESVGAGAAALVSSCAICIIIIYVSAAIIKLMVLLEVNLSEMNLQERLFVCGKEGL